MSISNLEDLFIHELRDVLDAERQLIKALPKMAKAATNDQLKSAFQEHLDVTQVHVERLETIFGTLDKAARGKHCMGMAGLVKEGEELIKEEEPSAAVDAALICAAQKVEHYEIAAYGSLASYAELLHMEDATELLGATLDEEKDTDKTLSNIAAKLNLVAQKQEA